MPRKTPEWQGASPDTAVPPRVRLRVFEKAYGRCQFCTGVVGVAAMQWQVDHIVPIIAGGDNREDNLQILCDGCHKGKTGKDVADKARVARTRQKHLGIKPRSKGTPMAGTKASGWRKRMDGTVERRR